MGDDFVTITQVIDELRLTRFIGKEGAAVNRVADLGLRQFAALRDPMDDLPSDRSEQRVDLLAMRRRHLGFGQAIHRGLELFAMFEFRGDPEKVEGAFEEWNLGIESGQADISHRLQPNLVERRCEIIGPRPRAELAKAVGKGQSKLALGTKRTNRVTQFLNFAEAKLVIADAREEHFDTRIARGGLDPVEDITQGGLGADKKPQQAVLTGPFCKALRQIDSQDDDAGERGDD